MDNLNLPNKQALIKELKRQLAAHEQAITQLNIYDKAFPKAGLGSQVETLSNQINEIRHSIAVLEASV